MSQAQHLFEAKKEARRLRQSLKESGDFLGVQGVNPETGEMDVLTPTSSSNSTLLASLSPRLGGLARMVRDTREAYREARKQHAAELERAQAKREQAKRDKIEREKEAIRLEQRKVRWRKEARQWSSVAEPNLSPIAQSQRSNTTSSEKPAKCSVDQARPKTPLEHASEQHPESRLDHSALPSPSFDEVGQASSETIIHTPSRRESPYSRPSSPGIGIWGANQTPLHPSIGNKDNNGVYGIPGVVGTGSQGPSFIENDAPGPLQQATEDGQAYETAATDTPKSFLGECHRIQTDPGGHAESPSAETVYGTANTRETVLRNVVKQYGSSIPKAKGQIRHQTVLSDEVTPTQVRPDHLRQARTLPPEAQGYNSASHGPLRGLAAQATASLARPKSLSRSPPKIPQRIASSRKGTSTVVEIAGSHRGPQNLETPPLMHKSAEGEREMAKTPCPDLVTDEPAAQLADTVMQDMPLGNRPADSQTTESASTLTTTTIGSDLSPVGRGSGSFDGSANAKEDQAIPGSNETTVSAAAFDAQPLSTEDTASSPAKATQRYWPSIDPRPETPTSDTMSSRKLTLIELRTVKLLSHGDYQQSALRASSSPPAMVSLASRTIVRTSIFIPRRSHGARSDLMAPPACGRLGEAMAQGAVQAALIRAEAAAGGPGHRCDGEPATYRRRLRPAATGPMIITTAHHGHELTNNPHDGGGTGGLFTTKIEEIAMRRHTSDMVKNAATLLATVTWKYWYLVQPAFDGAPPLARRFRERRWACSDVGVHLLAGLFAVLALLSILWAARFVLLLAGILRMAGRGLRVLIGVPI